MKVESLMKAKLTVSTPSTTRCSRRRRIRLLAQTTMRLLEQKVAWTMRTATYPETVQVLRVKSNRMRNGKRMRRCCSSILSWTLQINETHSLRTFPTQTGKQLRIWFQGAPPCSAKNAGCLSKISRARSLLGRLARPKFWNALQRKLPRNQFRLAKLQLQMVKPAQVPFSLKSGHASLKSSTKRLEQEANVNLGSVVSAGSMWSIQVSDATSGPSRKSTVYSSSGAN